MDALVALIAESLAGLRGIAPQVCPGGWAWATTLLGVGVGLLPAAGAITAARLRHRVDVRFGPLLASGAGLLTAGLLPYLAFTATGEVFTAAANRSSASGLSRAQLRDLGSAPCATGPQGDYLGGDTVASAFDPGRPLVLGLAVVAFVLVPLVTAMFVAAAAGLALRGAPKWSARCFWLPILALPVLAAAAPTGASAHLWLGVAGGAFVGIPLVLMARPSTAAVRRSLDKRQAARTAPAARRSAGARVPAAGAGPPAAVAGPRTNGRDFRPTKPDDRAVAALAGSRGTPLAQRLAERFAARMPQPPVVLPPAPAVGPVVLPPAKVDRPRPRPTLAIPEPRQAESRSAESRSGEPGSAEPVVVGPGQPARFRLIRRLGAGGFGRVWLAHDAQLGHLVAVKAAHAPDAETEQRIQREATALAAVGNRHCVRIYDLVHARSDPGLAELDGMVIVMEYVAGQSLGELVRSRGVLNDVAAARVWAAIADGLATAHRRGVLHRDVKPANLVVDAEGLAHLIDFGIARRTGDATLTLVGYVLGTPDYLAPEVAGGARATPASDAWQLAATISYAMTGSPPRGDYPDAISGIRAAASGAPLTHLPTQTAHRALLHAALDSDPERRPSLDTVHRALETWLRRVGATPDGRAVAELPGR